MLNIIQSYYDDLEGNSEVFSNFIFNTLTTILDILQVRK